jgi:hypothetical protein
VLTRPLGCLLHFTQERVSGQNVQKIDIARRESVEGDEARHSSPVATFCIVLMALTAYVL